MKSPNPHSVYCLEWCKKNAESHNRSVRKWRAKSGFNVKDFQRRKKDNPKKLAARRAVANALQDGRLLRPNRCAKCGKFCKPEAHHPNYLKKLEVIWLCRADHLALDGKAVRA